MKRTDIYFFMELPELEKASLLKPIQSNTENSTPIFPIWNTGNLYQDIVDMDFIDDPPEISEQERFKDITVSYAL